MNVKRILIFCVIYFCTAKIDAQFKDVSSEVGIHHVIDFEESAMGGGAVFFDFNNDGFEDLYVTGGKASDYLYQNLGDGSFLEISDLSGVKTHTEGIYTFGVISGDINNDGCEDLFVTTFNRNDPNLLLLNNCRGGFDNIAPSAGIIEESASTSAIFVDLNLDGFLDIYVTNYIDRFQFITNSVGEIVDIDRTCLPNFFYLNRGGLHFDEVATEWGMDDAGCGLAVIATDFDLDGDQDIYLANDHGEWVEPNKLYRNESVEGKVVEISSETGTDIGFYAMGIANGDFDRDGILDYYITNLGDNALLKSLDIGFYQDVGQQQGVLNGYYENNNSIVGWGTFFFDFDHDLDLDLFVSNGYIRAGYFSITTQKQDWDVLYENTDNSEFLALEGAFQNKAEQINRGAIYGDYDRDGDLDIFSVSLAEEAHQFSSLYQNQNSEGQWLNLQLEGKITNRSAFGTMVKVYVGDEMLLREVASGGSHASQNSKQIHLGLSNYETIDSLIIQWPSGIRERFDDIASNQHYYSIEGEGKLLFTGCMDPSSSSYVPSANYNAACFYEMKLGCTDATALNYEDNATVDDQSCHYTTSLSSADLNREKFAIYPNPADQECRVVIPENQPISDSYIKVINSHGKIFATSKVINREHKLNLSNLPSGIYMIQLIDKTGVSVFDLEKLFIR